jgi:hypothetical protein
MASPTKRTKLIRKRKTHNQGKKRKAADRANGTTKSMEELFGDSTEK